MSKRWPKRGATDTKCVENGESFGATEYPYTFLNRSLYIESFLRPISFILPSQLLTLFPNIDTKICQEFLQLAAQFGAQIQVYRVYSSQNRSTTFPLSNFSENVASVLYNFPSPAECLWANLYFPKCFWNLKTFDLLSSLKLFQKACQQIFQTKFFKKKKGRKK